MAEFLPAAAAMTFADLGVLPPLIDRLDRRDLRSPTGIQARVIPLLAAGENLMFRSATGTGKTLAYLLPMIQALGPASGAGGPELLVCAPTYELCAQIKGEADFLLEGGALKAGLFIGTAPLGRQIEALKKSRPAVAVGNPGRLLLLARMGKLRLGRVRFLVLDEGDRLVAEELYGESRDLAALLGSNAGERLSAACSATLPPGSRERLRGLMGEAKFLEEADDGAVYRESIEHWAFLAEDRQKIRVLRSFFVAADPRKTLVFTGRAGQVGNIAAQLRYHRVKAGGLSGDMDKRTRKQALDDFRRGRIRALVSSDLSARGLDIPDISHVAALDVPSEGDAYIHRAGRTGRAGKRGVMVTIGNEGELRHLAALEKRLGIVIYPKLLSRGQICAPAPAPAPEGGVYEEIGER
jgi:superfamily II DNA/RNA helicase